MPDLTMSEGKCSLCGGRGSYAIEAGDATWREECPNGCALYGRRRDVFERLKRGDVLTRQPSGKRYRTGTPQFEWRWNQKPTSEIHGATIRALLHLGHVVEIEYADGIIEIALRSEVRSHA